MNDAAARDLARRAGIALEWADYAGKRHQVPLDAARRILGALGLPCDSAGDVAHSRQELNLTPSLPPLITATVGEAIRLPLRPADANPIFRLTREDGGTAELTAQATEHGIALPALDTPGYHSVVFGEQTITLAVAPPQCTTVADLAPNERLWGLAAQTYGLRSPGDCGIGGMAGVAALAKAAAALQADALALSPAHALFAADPRQFSPYSPSSRLFYNALYADAAAVFGDARVAAAKPDDAFAAAAAALEQRAISDPVASAGLKLSVFRRLFDDFFATDMASNLTANPVTALAEDFAKFRKARGPALERHALFEALHASQLRSVSPVWSWKDWSPAWRDPASAAVKSFGAENELEILFHAFLQWIADRSFAAAQREAKDFGMRIGLIADLAVGINGAGSDAWANANDILGGLEIGAPPDLFNQKGQTWGLTTFSPRALVNGGFAPFIATMRAAMRHAGGVRIDHAMGLMRLWVVPNGAAADQGAYLSYPLADLLRIIALESHRHRAIVVGEDLGTVPAGFRDRLGETGIYGMSVLWFERSGARFAAPEAWPAASVAMTSTHDLPTVAGWWAGKDIDVRAQCGLLQDPAHETKLRAKDRKALWRALQSADATGKKSPLPDDPARAADAAVKFIARTPSRLALLPLEDALALEDQPNLPATIDEHPNWRRRYPGEAAALLDRPGVRERFDVLKRRGAP